jgi:hypothetical protein
VESENKGTLNREGGFKIQAKRRTASRVVVISAQNKGIEYKSAESLQAKERSLEDNAVKINLNMQNLDEIMIIYIFMPKKPAPYIKE